MPASLWGHQHGAVSEAAARFWRKTRESFGSRGGELLSLKPKVSQAWDSPKGSVVRELSGHQTQGARAELQRTMGL